MIMALFQLQFVALPITAAQNFLIASPKKSKNIKNWMFRGVTYASDMSKSVESKGKAQLIIYPIMDDLSESFRRVYTILNPK